MPAPHFVAQISDADTAKLFLLSASSPGSGPAGTGTRRPALSCRVRRIERRTGRERPGKGGPLPYFWMQVSAVSLVHSSSPVNTGSGTSLPSIRSIITVGAM